MSTTPQGNAPPPAPNYPYPTFVGSGGSGTVGGPGSPPPDKSSPAYAAWAKQYGSQQDQSDATAAQQQAQNAATAARGRPDETQRQAKDNAAGAFPGSANVGGYDGGAQAEREAALAHQHDNDAAQVGNDVAMDASLANMRGAGNRTNPENATLLARETASRNQQLDAVNLDRSAAEGNAPSAAAFASRQSGNDLMAQRSAALGGAHNAAGLSGAQVSQGQTAGMNATNVASNGGMARSKEIGDAIGMYGTQAGQIRQGDLQRLSTSNQNATTTADMNDKFSIGSGELAAKQGALGNSYQATDAGWYGQSMDPAERQFQYDQEMQAKLAGQDSAQAGAQIAEGRAKSASDRQLANGAVAGGLGLVGSIAGGPVGGAALGTGGGMMMSQLNGSGGNGAPW